MHQTTKSVPIRLLIGVVACVTLTLSGCSGDGTFKISGTVTVNGTPAETGAITFVPVDGQTPIEGAEIKNGAYQAKVSPGEKIVQIRAMKLEPGEKYDEISQTKVATNFAVALTDSRKYATDDSPLRVTVAQNEETHDFDLPSINKEK